MARGRMINKRRSIPKRVALYVIKRDKNTCQYCGKKGVFIFRYGKPCVVENPKNIDFGRAKFYNGRDVIPFQIDHIIPVISGGANNISNLVLSCRKCNLSKGHKEIREWLVED